MAGGAAIIGGGGGGGARTETESKQGEETTLIKRGESGKNTNPGGLGHRFFRGSGVDQNWVWGTTWKKKNLVWGWIGKCGKPKRKKGKKKAKSKKRYDGRKGLPKEK